MTLSAGAEKRRDAGNDARYQLHRDGDRPGEPPARSEQEIDEKLRLVQSVRGLCCLRLMHRNPVQALGHPTLIDRSVYHYGSFRCVAAEHSGVRDGLFRRIFLGNTTSGLCGAMTEHFSGDVERTVT